MEQKLNGHWIESTKDSVCKVFISLNALANYDVYENEQLSYSFCLEFDVTLSMANLRMISKSGIFFQGQYLFEWNNNNYTEVKILALNSELKYDVIGVFVKC